MTALDPLPFGAESVDELLAAYANGSLDPAARVEVERWLAVHPQWQPRLEAYRAIGAAVRSSAASSQAPSLDSLPGVWAGIDAAPQPRSLRPGSPPPPPPPPPSFPRGSGRSAPMRRSSSVLLALAAALIVAMAAASVVVVATRRGSEIAVTGVDRPETQATLDEEPEAETVDDAAAEAETAGDDEATGAADAAPATLAPPTEVPPPEATGGVDPDPRQALQDGAEATAEASTARTVLNAVGTLDLSGTTAADVAGTDVVTVTIDGQGSIAFPDRSQLESTTIVEGGFLTSAPESTSEIEVDGRRWIRCDEGAAYVEQVEGGAEAVCSGLDLGADLAGPNATVDLLEESDAAVELVGIEAIDGVDTMHYRFTSSFDDETGSVPVTVDAWLGRDDDLLRQLTATTAMQLPLELFGESLSIPTSLVLTINLTDFGAPVTIEPPA